MSNTNAVSPFQIRDWRILSFQCTNPILSIPAKIQHNWKLHAHIERPETNDNLLHAFVQITFHFDAKHGKQNMTMDGQCIALCEMDPASVENADDVFNDLLRSTAMINCLANLRVFLLQAGLLHQMGSKRIMLPFIKLADFPFDEDVEFTT